MAAAAAAASAVRISVGVQRLSSKSLFNLQSFAPKQKPLSFSKRQILTCTALQKPEISVKEEGQPETLDYRVFFLDSSGKKVAFLFDFGVYLGIIHTLMPQSFNFFF